MEALAWIERIFEQYGYFVLLLGLPIDFIALPLPPGQTTLTYTGYLSYKGNLSLLPAMLSAFAGAMIGVTTTYTIGYQAGARLLESIGRKRMISPKHLERTRRYYERYGNKLLLISYFLPGIRQFTGYFAGTLRVPFRTFALYSYTGAACWVTVFIGIGYGFGEQWQTVFALVEQYLKYIFIGFACVLAVTLIIQRFVRRRKRGKL
jgi:membrane protein DedA with SNARE-associated domain